MSTRSTAAATLARKVASLAARVVTAETMAGSTVELTVSTISPPAAMKSTASADHAADDGR